MSSAGGPGGKGKKGGNAKEAGIVKGLVERIEENAKWVEKKREGVSFAPNQTGEVEGWERDLREKIGEGPLGKYLKVLTKAREKRAKLIEKVRCLLGCQAGLRTDSLFLRLGERGRGRDTQRVERRRRRGGVIAISHCTGSA